ncbi:auxilin-like protein 1 isoform X2 [Benincasa hispida]|uniref:auxilin-like protein 1 isoform X2 n=1 Tax=Benincasa hispida TaxID=102211 RepID=UPI0019019DB5|nr:auxilin-like protein 1 isoform X2 [Benincasa hispida]
MDNLSHSRLPNRGSTSLSKKICNGSNGGGPFVAQTIYDDVYGGPPKFGVSALSPRFEDYGEIFGSFHALRASSIPILDLPAVDESEVFFDARSSAFDYAEVFGGFDGLDFAISYDELVGSSKGVDDGSSDEAWTPAGTESLSDYSDHSGNSHCMSNGDSNQSFGGSTEFCISYNKVNRESNGNISNGKIHVTQLEMLPGFSYLVDEANPSPKATDDDPSLQTNDDNYLNIDFDTGKVKGKHLRNTMPPLLDSNDSGPLFEDNLISQNGYGRGLCRSHEDFITVSEISLRTEPSQVPPPSRPPPKFATKNGDYSKRTLCCEEAASEIISDDHSLPLFDVEVDASSSAAASAAAMKEAMEKAQAQLQNAKDLWERKKEWVHGRTRLDSKNDMRKKEEKLTKIPNRFRTLADGSVQGIGEIHGHEMDLPAKEERQKDVKATEVCSAHYGGEELLTAAEKTLPIRSESRFLVSENYDYCSEWKDATEFFELARADTSGEEFESVNNDAISNFVTGQMGVETNNAWENNEDQDKKTKPFHTAHVLNEEVKNLENMVHGKEEDKIKLKPNRNETRQKEQVKLNVHQGVCDLESNDRKCGVAQQFMEIKKQMFYANESERREKPVEFRQLDSELKVEQPVLPRDIEQEKKKVVERKENGNILKESHSKENNANKMEATENEKREMFREASEREKFEQKMRVFLKQPDAKKRLNLVLEDDNFKGQMARERQLEGVHGMEDHGEKGKEAAEVGASETPELAHEREDDNNWPQDFQYREVSEKEVDDSFHPLNIGGMPRDVGMCKGTPMLVKDSQDSADLKGTSLEHDELERLEDRHKVNSTIGSQVHVEVNDLGISAAAFQMNDNKDHLPMGLACPTGMSGEFSVVDDSGERKTTLTVNETSSGSGGTENLQFNKNSCGPSVCQAEVEQLKVPVEMEDADIQLSFDELTKRAAIETHFQHKFGHIQSEPTNSEVALSSENSTSMDVGENVVKMEDMKTSLPLDRSDEKAGQADVCMEEFVGRKKFVTRMGSDPEHPESNLFCCMEDKVKSSDKVEDKGQKVSVQGVNVRAEKGSGLKSTWSNISDRTQKSGEFSREVNGSQAPERKENFVNQSHSSKGKESERVRSEAEFENDILRKLEEEREREREREKDRMPIDRISLEPRDRVGAETRERAERAALERMTAEARQRALADARERLEKACAEARENSLAGKAATMEARVKAERAAVERATVEARERAAEKAMFDKASFGVRERMERSVSDKFSASSRSNEMRQKSSSSGQPSLQSQSFGSATATRYAYYSAYDERNEGVDGESPQRCKARLERHQRTAERAAKALAEKNMRDLLAQREQAERNRIAETLDADVRRWSSGKEGNLRALLSTLQYILGPDSGWQPIPLTEVITAAAVKKAYRKATLCVHPDKLQQRGASIQQKYICEKVFDLLKEAWNKFNSEER